MAAIPDLVRLSKLETHVYPEYVQHIRYVSSGTTSRTRIRKEEKWGKVKELGRGAFGTVRLEHCIQGDDKGKARAVKSMRKLESMDYYRELEAVALFSRENYKECFVESFGWYEIRDDIFISMEYLHNGNLHGYLGSPLPEDQGQNIVLQLLEGIQYMHDFKFAHRDLKPAIADFGISKRASDGQTELRTRTGTPAFAAPEVLGFCPHDDDSGDTYTNAVDVWSLGVIAFFILTGQLIFEDPRRLSRYASGYTKFPLDILTKHHVGMHACEFLRELMAPNASQRPSAKQCLEHSWLKQRVELAETRSEKTQTSSLPLLHTLEPEPSASWSTQDQIPDRETVDLARESTEEPAPVRLEQPRSASPGVTHPNVWKLKATRKCNAVVGAVFSPDGEWIAIGSRHRIELCSTTMQVRRSFRKSSSLIYSIAFSPDRRHIASGGFDGPLGIWDVGTGAQLETLIGHRGIVYCVAYSPDGKQIVSGAGDRTIRLWDVTAGVSLPKLEGHLGLVKSVAFSPDGKQIASGSIDKTIRLWDVATGASLRKLEGHLGFVTSVAFSPDGKQIASGSLDNTIRLWDVTTGAPLHKLEGHQGPVWSVAFSPDGKQIASGSWDETIRLWDLETQAECCCLKQGMEVDSVAFSRDGKLIASASWPGKMLQLWEGTTETVSTARQSEGLPMRGRKQEPEDIAHMPENEWVYPAPENPSYSIPIRATPSRERRNPAPPAEESHAAPANKPYPSPYQPSASARTQAPVKEKAAKGFFKLLFS
ncbi:MAG: hypothetical protein Q9169_005996 [Polycauliona sp. 2 TL-2023]